ncbi:MAG: hypothetical protein ACRBEQ_12455 [Hyphomonas sp.]
MLLRLNKRNTHDGPSQPVIVNVDNVLQIQPASNGVGTSFYFRVRTDDNHVVIVEEDFEEISEMLDL